ncbi:MAG: alpha/beta fold hydrolase, partial [Polyangiales bacterium]
SRLVVPPFEPAPLFRGAHAQTVLVPYLPAKREVGERITVPIEGGALTGRLHRAMGSAPARACVLVLHGIAGTADEPFVHRTARLAQKRGLDALRLDLRGAGESADCGVPPLFHAGLTADVRAAIELLLARYERVHLIGFSLGGQIALRTVGEWGEGAPPGVASVTAVSPPIHLRECATFSERRAASIYRIYIVRALKQRYLRARTAMGERFHADLLRSARTVSDYDAAVVAPHFGFRDVEDYYAQASSESLIDRIAAPTLILHAADDPLVSVEPVQRVQRRRLPGVRVVVTERGGHVGFYGRAPAAGDDTRFWAEERAIDLAAALERAQVRR